MKIVDRDMGRSYFSPLLAEARVKSGLTVMETPKEEEEVSQAIAILLIEGLELLIKSDGKSAKEAATNFAMAGKVISEMWVPGGLSKKEFTMRQVLTRYLMVSPGLGEGDAKPGGMIRETASKICDFLKDYASGEKKVRILRGNNPLSSLITSDDMASILIYCRIVREEEQEDKDFPF